MTERSNEAHQQWHLAIISSIMHCRGQADLLFLAFLGHLVQKSPCVTGLSGSKKVSFLSYFLPFASYYLLLILHRSKEVIRPPSYYPYCSYSPCRLPLCLDENADKCNSPTLFGPLS